MGNEPTSSRGDSAYCARDLVSYVRRITGSVRTSCLLDEQLADAWSYSCRIRHRLSTWQAPSVGLRFSDVSFLLHIAHCLPSSDVSRTEPARLIACAGRHQSKDPSRNESEQAF